VSAVSSPSVVRGRAPDAHAFTRNFSSKGWPLVALISGVYSTPYFIKWGIRVPLVPPAPKITPMLRNRLQQLRAGDDCITADE